jgi:hypothetical protein
MVIAAGLATKVMSVRHPLPFRERDTGRSGLDAPGRHGRFHDNA